LAQAHFSSYIADPGSAMHFHLPLNGLSRRDCSPTLSLSPLTTTRTGCEGNVTTHRTDDSTVANTTARSSMVTAKLDVSDFLAPMEARIFARIDAVEAVVRHRCCRTPELQGTTRDYGEGAAAASLQEQLDELRRELADVRGHLDAANGKSKAWAQDVTELSWASDQRHDALRHDINELWRQLRADRQQGQLKHQEMSDALASHVHSLSQKIKQIPSPCLSIDEGEDFNTTLRASEVGGNVTRSVSTPTFASQLRSPRVAARCAVPALRSSLPQQQRSPRASSPCSAVRLAGPPGLANGSSSTRHSSPTSSMRASSPSKAIERRASAPIEAAQRLGSATARASTVGQRGAAPRTPLMTARA